MTSSDISEKALTLGFSSGFMGKKVQGGTMKKLSLLGLACVLVLGASLLGKTSAGGSGLLDTSSHFLLTDYGNYVQQYRYLDGAYQLSWQSGPVEDARASLWGRVVSGDVNGDTQREICTVWSYLTYTQVVKRTTIRHYSTKITFFKPGAPSGDPGETKTLEEETTTLVSDCVVAYLNGPAAPPCLVVLHSSHLDVYDLPSFAFKFSYEIGQLSLCITTGDTDRDGRDEIVVSTRNAPAVLELNNDGTGFEAPTVEPCLVYPKGSTGFTVVRSEVRDTDGDGYNEIVCGGNNERLMIWKLDQASGQYKLIFTSPSLGNDVNGVNAGNIDGMEGIEITATTWAYKKTPAYIWVFASGNNGYELKAKIPMTPGMVGVVATGNMDGDALDETFVATNDGLFLYKWLNGAYYESYIGEGYGPVEFY
jgi:hypothetical protein